METATFVPNLPTKTDQAATYLRRGSQIGLFIVLVLLPLFFLPTLPGLVSFPKVFLVAFGCLVALLFASLSVLRVGSVSIRFTPILISWWLVVLTGLISSIFTPSFKNALFGDALEIQTVGFLVLMGCIMSLLPLVGNSKRFITCLYSSFIISAVLAALLFYLRLVSGVHFLSFGLLSNLTDNFIGSFNDLGIFFGCIVIAILVSVAQLDLPKKGLFLIVCLLGLAFSILAIVNFFFVWLLIALFSLILLMYVLTKDRFGRLDIHKNYHNLPLAPMLVIGLVFITSGVFLVGGTALGQSLSNTTGVNYVEIRPSFSATIDILKQVYERNALTGIGPNQFAEAWNLYKSPLINSTIFWNTSFSAGGGFILTWFVTSGLFGMAAWFLFLIAYLFTGVKTLLPSTKPDTFWFFIGSVSFLVGLFIWTVCIFYVPGPTILLLGAVFTSGLVIVQQKMTTRSNRAFNLHSNSKIGFMLIVVAMICVLSILSVGYIAVKQFTAAYTFASATQNLPADVTEATAVISRKISLANDLYASDTYGRALANYQLNYISSLLNIATVSTQDQKQIQNAFLTALKASTDAITIKSSDARNWQMRGDIYASLAALNSTSSKEQAFASYKEAEVRDPQNPLYVLQKAIMEARDGNSDEARRLALLALNLKSNFIDALYFLSQLDIAAGDISTAIATTESLISIDANNPGRYYQLGVLYGAVKNTTASIAAFQTAINLNPNFANARYFLAQQYVISGNVDAAVKELEIIRGLSPDNNSVESLIIKIKSGEINAQSLTRPSSIVGEEGLITTENGVTTTRTVPDSELLVPVNTPAMNKSIPTKKTDKESLSKEATQP